MITVAYLFFYLSTVEITAGNISPLYETRDECQSARQLYENEGETTSECFLLTVERVK